MKTKLSMSVIAVAAIALVAHAEGVPKIDGWKPLDKPTYYNSQNVWNAINGAAEIYLDYGFEELLDRVYATLAGPDFNYEVWMSHAGTMPVDPRVTALESCRLAVQNCDLFLGIILPRYGSGKEKPADDSIVHEELREAIRCKKPRWILAVVPSPSWAVVSTSSTRQGTGAWRNVLRNREHSLASTHWVPSRKAGISRHVTASSADSAVEW